MLIRMCTTRADIPRTGEGIAFVHGEIQPVIAAMDGNNGFAMAVDYSSGRYVSIAAWTDKEALDATADRAPGLIGALARRLNGSEPSVEVFELAFAQVVKPVRVGYWGRLTRAEMPIAHLDRAVKKFTDTATALFDRYDGLAAIILFVNRASGVAQSALWFDSVQVLHGSKARSEELHELLAADLPAVKIVEVLELVLRRKLASGLRQILVGFSCEAAPDPPHGTRRDSSAVRANAG